MKLRTILVAATLLVVSAVAVHAQDKPADAAMKLSPEELMKGIENEHPAAYYVLAKKLFEADRKDEAIFWFYAGQLRYRFHLVAHPDLDPAGDPALFASLSETVGRTINLYALGDLEVLDATLEKVKSWDETTPNGFTSKADYEEQWRSTREAMEELVTYIRTNGDKIREQRTANGLPNRQ